MNTLTLAAVSAVSKVSDTMTSASDRFVPNGPGWRDIAFAGPLVEWALRIGLAVVIIIAFFFIVKSLLALVRSSSSVEAKDAFLGIAFAAVGIIIVLNFDTIVQGLMRSGPN